MKFHRMYALSLRHLYLIKSSFPRILDLIYWPTIQIILWGFISQFFTMYSDYYNNTIGVILSCAILYDFLFRSSISFNMLFLEEIWSRNFTNLFIAPLKISEIITSSKSVAVALEIVPRTLILANAYTWRMKEGVPIESGTISYRVDRCRFKHEARFNQSKV